MFTFLRQSLFRVALAALALLPLQSIAQTCSIPGSSDPAVLTTAPNSYFPGAASVAANATSIPLGAINSTGASTAISAGDLILVIQMQGAVIDFSNTNRYGDGLGDGSTQDNTGDPARGSISNTAGTYEFAVATGVLGGAVTLSAPLQNSYTNATASITQGQQTFQVIRVPQYSSLTLQGTIDVPQWNGTSGGVFVLDVAGLLNFNGAVINGNDRGFRGGGGFLQGQRPPFNQDYASPNGDPSNGAFKGEGIAGTPARVRDGVTGVTSGNATDSNGYPGGDRSRGAPGNAGGGGNQHNGGGGGGGNGGVGGTGGNTWNAITQGNEGSRYGGFGGASGYNGATRIVMGGGGGAGDQNNSAQDAGAGGAGGALAIIRAGSIAGIGTINLNGAAGEASTGTDASGAGGAGGSAFITSSNGVLPVGLTVNALGGAGANSGNMANTNETDGPGGGGGGGVFVTNSTGANFNSAGGAAGVMNNSANTVCNAGSPNPSCFATAGGNGVRSAITIPVAGTGVRPAAECLPDLRVSKATTTPLISTITGAQALYTINVQNFGGGARNVSLIDNALPPGWTLAAAPTYAYSLPIPLGSNNLSTGAEPSSTAGGASFPLQAAPNTVPPNGSSALTWRQFFLAPVKAGVPSSMTISMVVNIPAAAPVGCYHNPAGFTYLDPTRVAGDTTRLVTAATGNSANRAGTAYSGNTTHASGAVANVAGSNYSGLAGGPTAEDVCLQGDLSVTKTVSPTGAVPPGGTLTYTLSPRNNGRLIRDLTFAADQATDATNTNAGTRILANGSLQMVDTLPAGVVGTTGFFGTDWTCTQAGQVITCNRAPAAVVPLAATTVLTGVVGVVQVTQAACGAGPLVNNVSLTGFQAPYTDSLPANNTASVTSPAANCNANLTVAKTNGTNAVTAGGTTSYTVNFANAGPSSADGAVVRDVASAGLVCTVASCTASGGAICPAPLADLLAPAGTAIATFPAGGGLQYAVNCNVTATGQ